MRHGKRNGDMCQGKAHQDLGMAYGGITGDEKRDRQEEYSIDDYAPAVPKHNNAGQTKREFDKDTAEQWIEPTYYPMDLESLLADLGLTIRKVV